MNTYPANTHSSDLTDPTSFQRRIFLAVTGLSPQVVTETIYALGLNPSPGKKPFLVTEVHLLTTVPGARLARTALLHPDGGQFHTLLTDYPELGKPVFNESHIHLIRNKHGEPLDDIRTPAENASAADTITALLAKLTHDPKNDTALHVSIAGGRKTMGFYLGYAFSLFARPQDELSHVLVSEPFESHPDFFYPPRTSKRLSTRSGQYIDTADAVLTLANIPVVRLRHGQPDALLDGHATFNETVDSIQKSLDPPSIYIELKNRLVRCGDKEITLPPALIAWFAWWAKQRLENNGPQSWRTANAGAFLRLYGLVVGRHSAVYENTENRLKDGMEKGFFQENNSKLHRYLKQQLDLAAAPYMLVSTGKRPHTRHALKIPTHAITLKY